MLARRHPVPSHGVSTVTNADGNGDGLPDHVRRVRVGTATTLHVQLNLGHSLGVETSVPYANWDVAGEARVGELAQDGSTTTSLQGAWHRTDAR